MNIIDKIEKEQLKDDIQRFNVGDTVKVHNRVVEGGKERIRSSPASSSAGAGRG